MSATDWGDLARRILAAREFTHPLPGGVVFTLRTPTPFDVEMAVAEGEVPGKRAARMVGMKRLLLERGVIGWSGVQLGHVLKGAALDPAQAAYPVAFEPAGVLAVLDAQPEWAAALWGVLIDRIAEQNATSQAAAKN